MTINCKTYNLQRLSWNTMVILPLNNLPTKLSQDGRFGGSIGFLLMIMWHYVLTKHILTLSSFEKQFCQHFTSCTFNDKKPIFGVR